MSQFEIKILGLKRLSSQFRKAPTKTYKELDNAVKKGSLAISRDIKPFVPVDTGNLQRGIRPDFKPLMAIIRPHNAPYGVIQHRIHKTKSQFFPKGLAVAKPQVEIVFNKAVNNILKFIISK